MSLAAPQLVACWSSHWQSRTENVLLLLCPVLTAGSVTPLTSDGFVMHLPFPEHWRSSDWLLSGEQVLAFTVTVKRKATMHLAMESFTKPKERDYHHRDTLIFKKKNNKEQTFWMQRLSKITVQWLNVVTQTRLIRKNCVHSNHWILL